MDRCHERVNVKGNNTDRTDSRMNKQHGTGRYIKVAKFLWAGARIHLHAASDPGIVSLKEKGRELFRCSTPKPPGWTLPGFGTETRNSLPLLCVPERPLPDCGEVPPHYRFAREHEFVLR